MTLGGEGNQNNENRCPKSDSDQTDSVVQTGSKNVHRFQDNLHKSISPDDLIKEMLFRSFDQLPLGLVVWRAEENHSSIVGWYNLCENMFGWTSQEIIGRSFLDLLLNEEDKSTLVAIIEKLGAKYIPSIMLNQCHTKSNEPVLIKWCHTPIYDEQLSVFHVVSLAEVKTIMSKNNDAAEEASSGQKTLGNIVRKERTLQTIVAELENEKQQLLSSIRSNVELIITPILRSLAIKAGRPEDEYTSLLKQALQNLNDPFASRLETDFSRLTPKEVEVCNMIKTGLSSKQIANSLNVCEQTVVTQRKRIRRKIGIANTEINLSTFLRSLTS